MEYPSEKAGSATCPLCMSTAEWLKSSCEGHYNIPLFSKSSYTRESERERERVSKLKKPLFHQKMFETRYTYLLAYYMLTAKHSRQTFPSSSIFFTCMLSLWVQWWVVFCRPPSNFSCALCATKKWSGCLHGATYTTPFPCNGLDLTLFCSIHHASGL